jgi:hypothetical protein
VQVKVPGAADDPAWMSVRRSRSHYARLVDRKRSEPKLHHYVPQAYLARFGRDHKVAVRWLPCGHLR